VRAGARLLLLHVPQGGPAGAGGRGGHAGSRGPTQRAQVCCNDLCGKIVYFRHFKPSGSRQVATHDLALRRRLQKIPGLPLLRFENSVLTLDSPTPASRRMAHALERAEGQLEDGREAAQRPRAVRKARGVREAETAPTSATRRIQQCSRNAACAPPPERGGKKRAAAPNPLSRKLPKRRRNPAPPSSPEAPWSIIPPGKTRPRRKKQVPPPRGYESAHLRETGLCG